MQIFASSYKIKSLIQSIHVFTSQLYEIVGLKRWYECCLAEYLICLVTLLVKRDATHRNALETIPLETLKQFDDRRLNPANINTTGRNEL